MIMNNLKKKLLPYFVFSMVLSFAQTSTIDSLRESSALSRLRELTEQQKALLQERREIIKQLKAEFKASLTEVQKQLLENDSMDKPMRRKAFYESLTDGQKAIYRAMRKGVDASRGVYRKSLSKDQKHKIMKRRKHKLKHKDNQSAPALPPIPPASPKKENP